MGEVKGEEGSPLLKGKKSTHVRTVSLWGLVAITYFAVAGGPEGTETMIQTAGPLIAVLGIIGIGIIWSVPTALMTAELSTTFAENGGYTLWVRMAWGDFMGELAGFLQFVSSAVDAAIYPGLFLEYVMQTFGVDFSPVNAWAIQAGFIAVVAALNFAGIEQVGHGSLLFMILLLTPFVLVTIIAFTGVFTGTGVLGWEFKSSNLLGTVDDPDWAAFMMVLLWNMGYWEGASVCAGEITNVSEVFPQAIAIVFVIVVANYALPMLAFAGLDGNWAAYDNGYYIDITRNVAGPVFAGMLGCAQCFSVAGLFTNGVVKNAYQICGMGEQGMLPSFVAQRVGLTRAPWVSLLITFTVTCAMIPLGSFQNILSVDMHLYCLALLLEMSSLIRLRYTEPDLERPYRIPAEGIWLWLLFIPAAIVSVFAIYWGSVTAHLFSLGLLILGSLMIWALQYLRKSNPEWFQGVDGVEVFHSKASPERDVSA